MKTAFVITPRSRQRCGAVVHAALATRRGNCGQWHAAKRPMGYAQAHGQLGPRENTLLPGEGDV